MYLQGNKFSAWHAGEGFLGIPSMEGLDDAATLPISPRFR